MKTVEEVVEFQARGKEERKTSMHEEKDIEYFSSALTSLSDCASHWGSAVAVLL